MVGWVGGWVGGCCSRGCLFMWSAQLKWRQQCQVVDGKPNKHDGDLITLDKMQTLQSLHRLVAYLGLNPLLTRSLEWQRQWRWKGYKFRILQCSLLNIWDRVAFALWQNVSWVVSCAVIAITYRLQKPLNDLVAKDKIQLKHMSS